jgi:hypothetical protein
MSVNGASTIFSFASSVSYFRLVVDIHLWDVGSLYREKQQRDAPCGILKMSVNQAS